LLSDGGVHSHQRHLWALLELARRQRLAKVRVHAFLDGRDCPPQSGAGFVTELLRKMEELGTGELASLAGRYYAMDRDKRWDRVKRAYDAVALGVGPRTSDPVRTIQDSYAAGTTDEFLDPVVVGEPQPMRPG